MEKLDFNRIHKFAFDDLQILIDINGGSLHVIDQITWDFLDALEASGEWDKAIEALSSQYDAADLADVKAALIELIEANQLFTSDEVILNYKPHTEPIVKAVCLHIAHDCNLRCGYCFAGTGAFGGERTLMSLETGKKAIDFLIKASKHRKHIEIDFFGGEPLLNFDVVKQLTAYGKEEAAKHGKVFKFTLTTNGVLFNEEVQQFCNDNDMSAVLSLDGRPEVNDKMRPFTSGRGSYDIIIDKFKNFVDSRDQKDYYLRGTYTRHNLDFAKDVAHMAEIGFKELSVEPVVAESKYDYALTPEDIPGLCEQYDELTRHYWKNYEEGNGYNFFHFNVDLSHGPCLPKRMSGCGAGHDYLAISPEGDLYPCHQFVGEEEYIVGTVDTGITVPQISRDFQSSHILTKPICMKCWARFYCSGGCHANNLRYGGSLTEPYAMGCDLQRKRLESAIYLQVKKALHASM